MGKKAKLKQIRRMASTMPVIHRKAAIGQIVTGSELLDKGFKEIAGQPINEKDKYKQIKKVMVPVNHNREMKKLYNKAGAGGVNAYLQAIQRYMSAKKAKSA